MSRKCQLSGKGPMFGNNISHSHRKTRTKWLPNLQKKVFILDNGEKVSLRVCTKVIKTIERFGLESVLKKFKKKGNLILK